MNERIFLPTRKTLEQRLEVQRSRILKAHGIAKLWASGSWQESDAAALREALEGLCELLESVKNDISADALLAPESAEHLFNYPMPGRDANSLVTVQLSPGYKVGETPKPR